MLNSIFKQANDLIKQRQYQQALDILNPLFIDHSDEPKLWWLTAKANATLDKAKTRFALQKCLALKPNSKQVRRALQQLDGKSATPDTIDLSSVEESQPTMPETTQAVDHTAITATTNKVINNSADSATTDVSSSTTSNSDPSDRLTPTSDEPGVSDAATSGCFAFVAAIPVGAYIGATVIVVEIIIGFISMVLQDLSSSQDLVGFVFSVFFWIIGLIPLVVVGIIGAIGGGILGGFIGGVVGFINMIILTIGSVIHSKIAYIASLGGSSIFAVWLYDEFVIEEARKIADAMFSPWIADVNYIVVFISGLLISFISLAGMLGDSEDSSDNQVASDVSDEELKAMGGALLAPWKVFGKAAKGSLKAGGAAVGVGVDFIAPSQKNDLDLDWDKIYQDSYKEEKERQKRVEEMREEMMNPHKLN